jgi:DNA-binding transcriptional MerR regulator
MFSQAHIDHMRLARMAMRFTWLGGAIRKMTLSVVYLAAEGRLEQALERARALQKAIQAEHDYAHNAADVLERWAQGLAPEEPLPAPLTISQAAKLLDVTTEMLRNWERNNLIQAPRNPDNNYRQYGPAEISHLRVIRALRKAGYSMMSILRMTLALRQGQRQGLKQVLDTPRPDEDVFMATDYWITTLAELAQISGEMIDLLENNLKR